MENKKYLPHFRIIIPDEIIFNNILPRLPLKPIIRFKSVSKTWYSLISTPGFTKTHLKFSSLLYPHFLLQASNSLYTLAYDQHNTLEKLFRLDYPNPWPWNSEKFDVIGCRNGLICLYLTKQTVDKFHTYFVVWNPVSFQLREICTPFPQERKFVYKSGFGDFSTEVGDDYKIVTSFTDKNCLWVFSLRSGEWKSIDFPSNHPFIGAVDHDIVSAGIYLDDTIYWDVIREDRVFTCGFSLVDERFNLMFKAPMYIPPRSNVFRTRTKLCLFKGCLALVCHHPINSDVYIMKRQGDLTTSWEKLFSISHMILCRDTFLDFSITGKCLVVRKTQIYPDNGPHQWQIMHLVMRYRSELKLVEPTLEDLESSQGIDGFADACSFHYVESLVSPFTLM